MSEKISSNEYANISIITTVTIVIWLISISFLKANIYISITIAVALLIGAFKVFKLINYKVFYNKEFLVVQKNKRTFQISLMRIRKIKLTMDYVGSARKYRIEYLDPNDNFDAVSFFVSRFNSEFEGFIEYVGDSYPFVKIERWATTFDS
ncbi:hypothetical protein QQ020_07725 [Fulvivirgaceae bacterium BMA12]|uniref:Uncharacterized protein n=1 Tax=Agaribacillus aureus TaxID=3051825 RepID=A0ABT8L2K2_9BACT|nr:hypothetical protein [Fulvivirgaceae bacterium BMA12]